MSPGHAPEADDKCHRTAEIQFPCGGDGANDGEDNQWHDRDQHKSAKYSSDKAQTTRLVRMSAIRVCGPNVGHMAARSKSTSQIGLSTNTSTSSHSHQNMTGNVASPRKT